MTWQRINLRTGAAVGQPGPLPADLAGLDDAQLVRAGEHVPAWRGYGYVPAADPAPAERWEHKLLFMRRLTLEERAAVRAARAGDPVIDDFLYQLEQAEQVDRNDADLAAGLAYLESEGLLAAGRADAILA